MRFQQFLNEAVLSTGKLEKNVNLMVASLERKVGQRFWRFGGHGHYEKFKRDDGSSGMGISFVLDNGRMVRFNLENTQTRSSELSSIDVWKDLKHPEKPTMTLSIPPDYNIVQSLDIIATFIRSFNVTIKAEAFERIMEGKYDDKEGLAKKYGLDPNMPDDAFRKAVRATEKLLKLTGKVESSTLVGDIKKADAAAKKAKIADPDVVFEDLKDLTSMVAAGQQPSLLITGMAGVGKTFVVTDTLKKALGPQGEKWVLIKGKTSTMGLYGALFVNRDKVVVFDDCDSVFSNEDGVNILKAALDSYEKREISWVSKTTQDVSKMNKETLRILYAEIENALASGDIPPKFPNKFEFTGQIIFISNMKQDKMDDAIKSRSFVIDITLNKEGVLKRMKKVLPGICPDASMDVKEEILDYLVKETEGGKFNMRTFVNAVRIKQSGNPRWQHLVQNYA